MTGGGTGSAAGLAGASIGSAGFGASGRANAFSAFAKWRAASTFETSSTQPVRRHESSTRAYSRIGIDGLWLRRRSGLPSLFVCNHVIATWRLSDGRACVSRTWVVSDSTRMREYDTSAKLDARSRTTRASGKKSSVSPPLAIEGTAIFVSRYGAPWPACATVRPDESSNRHRARLLASHPTPRASESYARPAASSRWYTTATRRRRAALAFARMTMTTPARTTPMRSHGRIANATHAATVSPIKIHVRDDLWVAAERKRGSELVDRAFRFSVPVGRSLSRYVDEELRRYAAEERFICPDRQ